MVKTKNSGLSPVFLSTQEREREGAPNWLEVYSSLLIFIQKLKTTGRANSQKYLPVNRGIITARNEPRLLSNRMYIFPPTSSTKNLCFRTSTLHPRPLSESMANDTVDKLVVFLAKRDGIDKLVKTFQYVSKLAHYRTDAAWPDAARRAKRWEVAAGLSRKAFRSGRFLTGFNALRRGPGPTPTLRLLAVVANAGEMVYFFFDHFLWLARIGVLDERFARRMSFVSAFGESVGYIFFIILDFIAITKGMAEERRATEGGREKIRGDRVMRLMATSANVADLVIAVADIEPNPVCCHPVVLGISGLVSAWAGWYRNWPV